MANEKYIHINSENEVLDFWEYGISFNKTVLRDFLWQYSLYNNALKKFYKEAESFTLELTVNIRNKNPSEVKNLIYEHFEKDIINKKAGQLIKNDYKLDCFFIGSSKKDYLIADRYLKLTFTVLCLKKEWYKETQYLLDPYSISEVNDSKRYTYTYPYIYSKQKGVSTITNNLFTDADVIIRLFGPCTNPFIKIKDNLYQVNITLEDAEYIEINTKERTCIKITKFGETSSVFHYRNKEYNIYEKIPSGSIQATWNGYFRAEIVVIECRSEPLWD